VPLRDDQAFFERFFIDAGALCWPHGLELSPDPPMPPTLFTRLPRPRQAGPVV
jgi:hypothetical protein